MATILGFEPEPGTIVLSEGADFQLELMLSAGSWPVGTTATIKVLTSPTPTVWAATLSGASLKWKVEQAATTAALVPARTRFRLIISLPAVGGGTTTEFARYTGSVQRKD